MRVAIITESFPPDVNGVAHCVLRVTELLAQYGHQPLVIAPQPPREGQGDTFPFPVVRVPAGLQRGAVGEHDLGRYPP